MSEQRESANERNEKIAIVDDDTDVAELVREHLEEQGYSVTVFQSATNFLGQRKAAHEEFDLIISDISMPGDSGHALCQAIRSEKAEEHIPVILLTGSDRRDEQSIGIEAGADHFVQKPFAFRELAAKVRSLLDIRAQESRNHARLDESRAQNSKLARFVPSQVANLLTSESLQNLLKPHRAEVSVFFSDLRRFTAFATNTEHEEVLEVLNLYYQTVGEAALKYKGTLGHLAGDGIMVFFNDPLPIEHHRETCVRMALDIREALAIQRINWTQRNYDIDFGMGLAEGNATIGEIGFEGFRQYTVIGPVTNFAARLCAVADHGQILVSERFLGRASACRYETERLGALQLKGVAKAVSGLNILSIAES